MLLGRTKMERAPVFATVPPVESAGAQYTFAGQTGGRQPGLPESCCRVPPRLDAVQGSSPGMACAEGRVDRQPASGIFTDLAQDSGTDRSSPEEGLLGSRANTGLP